MQRIWKKILLGLGIVEEEKEELSEDDNPGQQFWKKNNIVEFPSQESTFKFVVKKPLSFAEAENMGEHLKMKRVVVVNLEEMEPEEAKRVIDFLSGVTFAINGYSQKVNRQIFLFAPAGVALDADLPRNFHEDALRRKLNDNNNIIKQ